MAFFVFVLSRSLSLVGNQSQPNPPGALPAPSRSVACCRSVFLPQQRCCFRLLSSEFSAKESCKKRKRDQRERDRHRGNPTIVVRRDPQQQRALWDKCIRRGERLCWYLRTAAPFRPAFTRYLMFIIMMTNIGTVHGFSKHVQTWGKWVSIRSPSMA